MELGPNTHILTNDRFNDYRMQLSAEAKSYETYSFYMNIYYYSVAVNFTVTSMNGTGPGR